jgi:hypothetical protein
VKTLAHGHLRELVAKRGAAWVARKLGVSPGTIAQWNTFGRLPQPITRQRAWKELKIPVGAWEAEAASLPILPPTSEVEKGEANGAAPTDAHDPRANCMSTLTLLRQRLAVAEPEQVATLANAITSSSRLLARLSGSLEVTEAQILRSEPWQRLVKLIRETLAKHPEAAKDLQKAMHEYEAR